MRVSGTGTLRQAGSFAAHLVTVEVLVLSGTARVVGLRDGGPK